MMYVMDAGAGKIVGLKYDPITGMSSREDTSDDDPVFMWVAYDQ
jgi:hypothetical protein